MNTSLWRGRKVGCAKVNTPVCGGLLTGRIFRPRPRVASRLGSAAGAGLLKAGNDAWRSNGCGPLRCRCNGPPRYCAATPMASWNGAIPTRSIILPRRSTFLALSW
jgi:hypothetical protein